MTTNSSQRYERFFASTIENGRIVGHGAAGAMANDPAVRRAYLGGAVQL